MRPASLLALVLALALALPACNGLFSSRAETCGLYPKAGGPAVIATRDQELCEVVRLRIARHLDQTPGLTRSTINRLIGRTVDWEGLSSLAKLFAAVREDAGDDIADEVERAAHAVITGSGRPRSSQCLEDERCFVKGVARGVRLALVHAEPAPVPAAPGSSTGVSTSP